MIASIEYKVTAAISGGGAHMKSNGGMCGEKGHPPPPFWLYPLAVSQY